MVVFPSLSSCKDNIFWKQGKITTSWLIFSLMGSVCLSNPKFYLKECSKKYKKTSLYFVQECSLDLNFRSYPYAGTQVSHRYYQNSLNTLTDTSGRLNPKQLNRKGHMVKKGGDAGKAVLRNGEFSTEPEVSSCHEDNSDVVCFASSSLF